MSAASTQPAPANRPPRRRRILDLLTRGEVALIVGVMLLWVSVPLLLFVVSGSGFSPGEAKFMPVAGVAVFVVILVVLRRASKRVSAECDRILDGLGFARKALTLEEVAERTPAEFQREGFRISEPIRRKGEPPGPSVYRLERAGRIIEIFGVTTGSGKARTPSTILGVEARGRSWPSCVSTPSGFLSRPARPRGWEALDFPDDAKPVTPRLYWAENGDEGRRFFNPALRAELGLSPDCRVEAAGRRILVYTRGVGLVPRELEGILAEAEAVFRAAAGETGSSGSGVQPRAAGITPGR